MDIFKYKPYYRYSGPTHAEPMREELADDEVEHRIKLFSEEIAAYFEEGQAVIDTDANGHVCVSTRLTQKDCDERVKQCLNSLDLYADKITFDTQY